MDALIITLAPTGNVPTKDLNPATPLTAAEIARDAAECAALGVSIVHLHARDLDGRPTLDRARYAEVLDAVRQAAPELVTQLSTGARGGENTADARGQMIDLGPDMASLATGSSNFSGSVNANPPELIESLATRMKACGVKPEIECFDLAMISNACRLAERGIIDTPMHFNLVMGVPGSIAATGRNLRFMVESLPEGSTWTACGIGRSQVEMVTLAIELGGGVRTGLEDALIYDKGIPATNAMLVDRVVRIASEQGRRPASPDETRRILSL